MTSSAGRASRVVVAAVIFVLLTLAVGGFLLTRANVNRAESRLLAERSSEVGALLSATVSTFEQTLQLVGEAYARQGPADDAFASSASLLIGDAPSTIAVVRQQGDEVVVQAVQGPALARGAALDAGGVDVVARALATDGLVTGLVGGDRTPALMVAIARDDELVVVEQTPLSPVPVPSTDNSPFRGLEVVLYRTPTADPDNLVVTTTADLPPRGRVHDELLAFGADQWLMQTTSNVQLAGSMAHLVPYIVLFGGLIAAAVTVAILVLLVRRRTYAEEVAEQRTLDLQRAMMELETARAAADAANHAKSHFMSRMSHELRTPLNAVLGFAQLLELTELSAEDRDAVEHILKAGNHLLTLINEVIDISRIETGDLTLSPESVLVSEVVGESLDLLRPLAAARSIHLVADRGATCQHYVVADRQRLKQIMLNLVSNAIKYNRLGGTVSVSCEAISSVRVRVKVTDTGSGIRPEKAPLLFSPFERLGAELTDIEGSGMGLALSRQLAEAMGGELDFESQVGVGSTFWLELPLVEGAVERYERLGGGRGEPMATPSMLERRRVLYIEDNLANIKLVQRIVDGMGDIELMSAMQGRLGLDLARDHLPSLVLLDLHLPDMAGDELLSLLRDDPTTSGIPIVVVSADATTHQVQRLMSSGASAYLTKPFNVNELRSIITQLVSTEDVVES